MNFNHPLLLRIPYIPEAKPQPKLPRFTVFLNTEEFHCDICHCNKKEKQRCVKTANRLFCNYCATLRGFFNPEIKI